MPDQDIPEFIHRAEQIYRDAVAKNKKITENLSAIKADFSSELAKEFGADKIALTGSERNRLAIDYAWTRLNARAGRATQRLLKDVAGGQLTLSEVEDAYDTVLTSGKDRRILLRHIEPGDLQRMLDERIENYQKMGAALEEFRQIIATIQGWLAKYGTLPQAVKDGGVPTVQFEDIPEDEQ